MREWNRDDTPRVMTPLFRRAINAEYAYLFLEKEDLSQTLVTGELVTISFFFFKSEIKSQFLIMGELLLLNIKANNSDVNW